MGCSQSKIENEEAVARCKERRLFMKEAVSFRNAFAAAHSSYATNLKSTGGALSDFAKGEVQHRELAPAPAITAAPQHFEFPPPPPLPPDASSPPLYRAASMPEMMHKPQLKPVGTIVEEEGEEEENELENDGRLSGSLRRRSSRRSGGGGGSSRSGTKGLEQEETRPSKPETHVETHPMSQAPVGSAWDYFFPSMENVAGTSLKEEEEDHLSEEEEIERKVFDEKPNRVDAAVDEAMRRERDDDEVPKPVPMPEEEEVVEPPAVMAVAPAGKDPKKVKQASGGAVEVKRKDPKKVYLVQIFTDLDDRFLNASESAHEVSKMLEATRMHYHSNFADNRGHIDHSARVMRVITWNRSFKGIPNLDDGKDDFDLEEHETHATVLDKLLAWEKKLYDEVKAGELMKFEYQRKVATLNKLKKRVTNSEALEKAKATVSHLHTRYIVDMQSLDSTVSEINRLRDERLFPILVQLVDGMATMWESMRDHHEEQSHIVTLLSSVDDKQSPEETSQYHHDRTCQLLAVVQEWQSQFEKLVNNQKGYIKALNCWLKLNLIPIESNLKEKVSSPPRVASPPIRDLLQAWHDHLEKLPDEIARTAIANFAAVIDTIFHQQEEEMDLKRKCEDTRKDLARRTKQFHDWYNKYMLKKIPGEFDADGAGGTNETDAVVTEKQFIVEQLKKRLEEDEEAYKRQCRQVRQKSLGSLKNRLPELFRALLSFSRECSRMYNDLRLKSQNLSSGQRTS